MPTKQKHPRVLSESGDKSRSTRGDRGREAADHRRTGDTLRESEQRLRQLAENIREVFWMEDVKAKRLL
jgi:PAS domain-containing protein